MPKTARSAQFSPTMTLAEALETAMAFEMTAYRFYLELAGRVLPEIRHLVLELAAEEQEHHRLLAELASDPDLGGHLEASIQSPPSAERFLDGTRLPALPDQPIEDDVLAYAEARERIAQEHYGHLAEATPAGPLQDLFRFLEREERRHADSVSTRWSAMFSIF